MLFCLVCFFIIITGQNRGTIRLHFTQLCVYVFLTVDKPLRYCCISDTSKCEALKKSQPGGFF